VKLHQHQHHDHAHGHDAGHGVVHVLKVTTSILYREVPKPLAFSNCFANCAGRAWRTLKNKGSMLSARRPVKLTEAASVHSLPLSSNNVTRGLLTCVCCARWARVVVCVLLMSLGWDMGPESRECTW
jgi:hypothetical protein